MTTDYMGNTPSQKLNARQERFCQEYIIDLCATRSAIRAGYSPKTANEQGARLLAHVSVAERVRELQHERAKRKQIDADYVIEVIVETVTTCKQTLPRFDREGHVIGEAPIDAGAVLKGAELLGKHLSMWKDRVEMTGELTLAELIKQARNRDKQR